MSDQIQEAKKMRTMASVSGILKGSEKSGISRSRTIGDIRENVGDFDEIEVMDPIKIAQEI